MLENKVLYYKRLRDNMVTCKGCREELVYSEFQTHECKVINLTKDDINMAEEILQASNEDFLVSFLSLIIYCFRSSDIIEGILPSSRSLFDQIAGAWVEDCSDATAICIIVR